MQHWASFPKPRLRLCVWYSSFNYKCYKEGGKRTVGHKEKKCSEQLAGKRKCGCRRRETNEIENRKKPRAPGREIIMNCSKHEAQAFWNGLNEAHDIHPGPNTFPYEKIARSIRTSVWHKHAIQSGFIWVLFYFIYNLRLDAVLAWNRTKPRTSLMFKNDCQQTIFSNYLKEMYRLTHTMYH